MLAFTQVNNDLTNISAGVVLKVSRPMQWTIISDTSKKAVWIHHRIQRNSVPEKDIFKYVST